MLSTILLGSGATMLVCAAFAKPKQENIEKEVEPSRTELYTKLFTSLKLMDSSKGDWIDCKGVEVKKNYKLVKFKLSDTLSCVTFCNAMSKIKEKMQVKHLEIYNDKGFMYFRIRNDKLELEPYEFKKTAKYLVPLGLDIEDSTIYWNMKSDPHMLICGATGSGKSRLLNSVISHLYQNNNADLYLIDLKRGLEFGQYKDTKNVAAYAQLTIDAKSVISAFDDEQERRYNTLSEAGYRDYNDYIKDKPNSSLKRAFLIIDEFADLQRLNSKKKDEEYDVVNEIVELACKVRCVGMHIICATQRPTNSFISSDIKANLQCVIGMHVMNEYNSRLVIDEIGLEELNRAEAIGIVESKKVFFRAYDFQTNVMDEISIKYAKPKSDTELPNKNEHKDNNNKPPKMKK